MRGLWWLIGDQSVTKRQLGWLMIGVGGVLAAGTILLELAQAGQGGFGAVQQIAAVAGVLGVVIGLTLLPLGDRPA